MVAMGKLLDLVLIFKMLPHSLWTTRDCLRTGRGEFGECELLGRDRTIFRSSGVTKFS